jgi:hypothetical protein
VLFTEGPNGTQSLGLMADPWARILRSENLWSNGNLIILQKTVSAG